MSTRRSHRDPAGSLPVNRASAGQEYEQWLSALTVCGDATAGVTDPRRQIHMAEVHDCFSITEAVLMEDLGFSAPGRVIHDVLDGVFDRAGALPVQPDGGLKCFGHPIGASGLRMVYEIWQQIHGRAGARQLKQIDLGLTQNLGGHPHQNVCAVAIIGREGV